MALVQLGRNHAAQQVADNGGEESPADWGQQAFALLRLHGISPTPAHYRVFYGFVTGEPAALRRELQGHLNSGDEIPDHVISAIHERHFPQPETAGETSLQVQSELERALSYLKTAEHDTSRFGSALLGYSDTLAGVTDAKGFRGYIDALIAETRAMEEKSRALETKLKRSSGEIDKLKSSLEQARLEAITDELTGVGNRKRFDQILVSSVEDAARLKQPLSLIFCDVDHFKTFNDNWGHKLGDHVLKLVGHVLKTLVGGKGVPTRYGGEEFAILLPAVPLAEAGIIAERLRLSISKKTMKTKSTGTTLGRITMSFGVSQYIPREDIDGFVGRADHALYEAKKAGRNCVMLEQKAR